MSAILNVSNASKIYRPSGRDDVVALNDASLQLAKGEFKIVRGASGSGKTTLLLAAGGLLAPDQGTIGVNGEDVYSLTSEKRAAFRAANIGFVFQQFHLIPFLNVLENVLAPTLALARDGVEQRARHLIDLFGLTRRIDHPPSELSTGERQRVALARALLNEPVLLLADEPTGNLDDHNTEVVLKLLRDYVSQGGAVLLATHDFRMKADQTFSMKDGELMNEAPDPR